MTLRRYAADVFGWSRYQPDKGYEFNGTALAGPDGNVLLVDPVPASDEDAAELFTLGSRFTIVLLNADHERDAAHFARDFKATVRICSADAKFLRGVEAAPFDHGEKFAGGWVAHCLSAMKTPGETVLHHPAKRILIAGDAVIADPVTGLRLVPPGKLPDREGALRSLSLVAELDFDALFLGDGFVLPTGGRDALRRFLKKEGISI